MTVLEMQKTVATTGEPAARVIAMDVLTPIPGARPAGEDIRGDKLWVTLRAARPKADAVAADDRWAPLNPQQTDWPKYRDLVEEALCNRTKDLELALFLTEASARVHGFAGVRDGLWMIGALIAAFVNEGLHPQATDGDFSIQYGKLNWLNEKFSDVIREIPITRRPEPEPNYSLIYRDESRRQGGIITAAEFEAAASAGKVEEYDELLAQIEQARAELGRFEQLATQQYGAGMIGLSAAKETLEECRVAVQGILIKRKPAASGPGVTGGPQTSGATSGTTTLRPQTGPLGAGSDAWSECERMAGSGNVDGALATMAALAAAEPNGRVRFQRKLLLADLCLQTDRKRLGASILEELNQIVERHKLEEWETSEIVGGVWARLVRCYRDKAAGTADELREAEFYLKLSRLDPWQALACGELARKE